MALSLGKLLLAKLASIVVVVVGTTGLSWLIVNALRPDLRAGDDRPLFVALADYLESAFLHFDFGSSTTASNREVETLIRQGLPVDLSLLAGGLAVGLSGGIAGGALCAARPGTLSARVLDALAVLFICTPVYVLGLALLLSFGAGVGFVHSGIVPVSYVPFAESPPRWVGSLLAPWFVLGFPLAGACLRLMRSSMVETLEEDYVRTAVAKGLRRRTVVGRHALRPALPPVFALTTVSMPVVVTNLVLIERVFTVPGVFTGMRRRHPSRRLRPPVRPHRGGRRARGRRERRDRPGARLGQPARARPRLDRPRGGLAARVLGADASACLCEQRARGRRLNRVPEPKVLYDTKFRLRPRPGPDAGRAGGRMWARLRLGPRSGPLGTGAAPHQPPKQLQSRGPSGFRIRVGAAQGR